MERDVRQDASRRTDNVHRAANWEGQRIFFFFFFSGLLNGRDFTLELLIDGINAHDRPSRHFGAHSIVSARDLLGCALFIRSRVVRSHKAIAFLVRAQLIRERAIWGLEGGCFVGVAP